MQIFFESMEGMQEILCNKPWCFNNNLLAFQQWDRTKSYEDEDFKNVKFWIHARV